jgi:hypothetical protein
MKRYSPLLLLTLLSVLLAAGAAGTSAQVATLQTPGPDAETTAAPAEELDGEEAILAFVACLREHDIDIPDPQFGAEGGFFAGDGAGAMANIDFMSKEFLDAMEACQHLLESLQPELDPEQVAEQNEQLVAFAECMRSEGIDFPDPDPLRGMSLGAMRGEDGGLAFDPFSTDFQEASRVCFERLDVEAPPTAVR